MNQSNTLIPLFSSAKTTGTDNWSTPKALFDKIEEAVFSNALKFELDPCADELNTKCPKFYNEAMDGLKQPWASYKRVFVNFPYSEAKKWVKKAQEEVVALRSIPDLAPGTSAIVMLVPARTDTVWWHNAIEGVNTIVFLKGRVKFGNAKSGAPFPSAILVYTEKTPEDGPTVYFEDWRDDK